jgi:hypothetical protein
MTAIAVTTGAGSGLIGVLVSTRYDVAAGGAITVVTGAMFALSITVTTACGAVATWRRRSRQPTVDTPSPTTVASRAGSANSSQERLPSCDAAGT